uniref:Uncharacterized protein n=1 Tax=Callorhinchus milii TaxID=7868 RepID=A0A4W3GVG7_CALMI
MKRGLISSPPADMLPTPESRKSRVWFCLKASGIGAKPRLFTPYIEEAKAVLDDLMSEQTSLDKVRVSRISSVPDTLYMVDSAITDFPRLSAGSPHSFEERVPVSLRDEIPIPPIEEVRAMFARVKDLRHSDQVQRSYTLNLGAGATITHIIQLRVVREFGLPDSATELLKVRHPFPLHGGEYCGSAVRALASQAGFDSRAGQVGAKH